MDPDQSTDRCGRGTGLSLVRLMALSMMLLALVGCATIRVDDADPRAAFAERRGDYLTTGVFSAGTRSALFALGSEARHCERSPSDCTARFYQVGDRSADSMLAVLSELSLAKALRTEQEAGGFDSDEVIAAYLDAARFAYAYLFLGNRASAERALEDRQTRVRDHYNFSVERVAALVFQRTRPADASVVPVESTVRDFGHWSLTIGRVEPQLQRGNEGLASIISPTRFQIRGLQNTYRRDGLGAELVAVWAPDYSGQRDTHMREIGFSPTTVLLEFEGNGLDEVLSRREARLLILDPNQSRTMRVRGQDVPESAERLRASFTSIHQLDAADAFLQATSRLNIADEITYHSIIARNNAADPPESSSDGVVPFASAYLPGAASTLLVNSGHGVQQTPEAIVEIRRILHLHLANNPKADGTMGLR